MIKTLASCTGSGWKGYTGGVLLVLLGIVQIGDAAGIDILPDVTCTLQQGLETIFLGLAAFGIRHKLG